MKQEVAVSLKQASSGPRAIGRYEILRPLATGGMAEIFLGRIHGIEGFQKPVVIKRLRPELGDKPVFVEMFLDEARLMASLQHSNIVQVFDVGSAGGAYFFSMELLRGEDLRGVVKQARATGGLPLHHALFILAGALEGLHHAHERRGPDGQPLHIVHRDVSPSNIFVTYEGGVKILDFGVAKTTVQTTQTRAGTLKGKIRYMSPEQCLGRPVDRRSDVFSAAIVLWELTLGRKLYAGGSDFELMRRIIDTDAPAPTSLVPDYPPELEAIVLRGLARDPEERYPTAEAFQADIEHFAREHRLVMSSRALGRYMSEQFADKVAVWAAAEEKGEAFAEHILDVFDGKSHSEAASVDSASRPGPASTSGPRHSQAGSVRSDVVGPMSVSGVASAEIAAHAPRSSGRFVAFAALILAVGGGLVGWALAGSGAAKDGVSSATVAAPLPPSASAVLPGAIEIVPSAMATAPLAPSVIASSSASAAPSGASSSPAAAQLPPSTTTSAAFRSPVGGGRPLPTSAAGSPPSATATSSKPPRWDLDSPVLPQ